MRGASRSPDEFSRNGREVEHRARQHAEHEGDGRTHGDGRRGQHRRVRHARTVADGLVEVHDLDDPDVEERGDDARDHGGHHDRPGAGGEGHGEDRELAHEPGRERDARHGQQEEGEDRRHHGRLLAEPGPPVDRGGLATGVADQADHGEGADRREAVGRQVEEHGLDRGDLAERPAGRRPAGRGRR